MKFTEGYWLRSERANAMYASQAYIVREIPGGIQVVAPERVIHNRDGALDVEQLQSSLRQRQKTLGFAVIIMKGTKMAHRASRKTMIHSPFRFL